MWQWASCWSSSPVKQPVVSLKIFFWSSRSYFLLFCPCFCHVIFLFVHEGKKVYAYDRMVSKFVDLLWQRISNWTCLTYLTECFLFLLLQLFTQSRLLYFFTLTAAPPCGSWRTYSLLPPFQVHSESGPQLYIKDIRKAYIFSAIHSIPGWHEHILCHVYYNIQ